MGPFIDNLTVNNLPDAETCQGGFSSYTIPQRMLDLSRFIVENDSYFATCERDDKGRCTSGGGKDTTKDQGIDIEAKPVSGEGKKGSGTATGKGADVATAGLKGVDKWLAGESTPKGPPGPVGKLISSLSAKFGHLEHAGVAIAKASASYVKDKVAESAARLPGPLQKVANATFIGLRIGAGVARSAAMIGVKAGFSYWTGISKIAEKVAANKGATAEQAKKISTALSSLDMKALEVAKGGALMSLIPGLGHALHFTHPLAQVTATIPVATTAYLATNSVAHPVHTIKAAGSAIADLGKAVGGIAAHPVKTAKAVGKYAASEFKKGYNIGGISKGVGTKADQAKAQAQAAKERTAPKKAPSSGIVHHSYYISNSYGTYQLFNYPTYNADTPDATPPDDKQIESVATMVADALEAHDYDDWYLALFCAALDDGQKVPEAIDSADAAYEANPDGPGEGTDEDDQAAMKDLYGDLLDQMGESNSSDDKEEAA